MGEAWQDQLGKKLTNAMKNSETPATLVTNEGSISCLGFSAHATPYREDVGYRWQLWRWWGWRRSALELDPLDS